MLPTCCRLTSRSLQLDRLTTLDPTTVLTRPLPRGHIGPGCARSSAYDRSAPWRVNWGEGFQNFDAIVVATGFHMPRLVRDETGEMEIEVRDSHGKTTLNLSHRLTAEPTRPAEQGNLWFVGPLAHSRVPISSALFVTASMAAQVTANLKFHRSATTLGECCPLDSAGTSA
jgi:hypothetical protein